MTVLVASAGRINALATSTVIRWTPFPAVRFSGRL